MNSHPKVIQCSLVLYLLLVISLTGCYTPEKDEVSPYLQNIVSVKQEPAIWYLSPMGDKLLYDTTSGREQTIVRFLATGQEVTIAYCPRFVWLDNERIYCYDFHDHEYVPSGVIDQVSSEVDTFQRTGVKEVTSEQVDLELLLNRAKAIYRLRRSSGPYALMVLDSEPQKNTNQYYHITGIENLDEILEGRPYTVIPIVFRGAELSKKVYSPNKKYYYLLQDNLGIYDATSDQLLAKFKPLIDYESYFWIGGHLPNKSEGWASDNSGVYFQISHPSGFGPPPPIRAIQKLCVPDSSGCSPTN